MGRTTSSGFIEAVECEGLCSLCSADLLAVPLCPKVVDSFDMIYVGHKARRDEAERHP